MNRKRAYLFAIVTALLVCFCVSSSFGTDTAFAIQKKTQKIYRTSNEGERTDSELPSSVSWTISEGKMKLNFAAETPLRFTVCDPDDPSDSAEDKAVIQNGYLVPKSDGVIKLTIIADETTEYYEARHSMTVALIKGEQPFSLDHRLNRSSFNLSEGSCTVIADWDNIVKTSLTCSSSNKNIATIDENKVITFHRGGEVTITFELEGNAFYKGNRVDYKINIIDDVNPNTSGFSGSITADAISSDDDHASDNGSSNASYVNVRKKQTISGAARIYAPFGSKVDLKQTAKTALSYRSGSNSTAVVSSKGVLTFKRPGTVKIYVTASASKKYLQQKKTITVSAKIKTPKLKAKRRKGSNKLIWSKIEAAAGYELFVKYPSASGFVRAVTKKGKVKSVTHSDLARGKVYKYKVRACVQAGKKKFYSPFSKTIKVRSK